MWKSIHLMSTNWIRRISLHGMKMSNNELKQSLMHFSRFVLVDHRVTLSHFLCRTNLFHIRRCQENRWMNPSTSRTHVQHVNASFIWNLSGWVRWSTAIVSTPTCFRLFILDHLKSKQHKRMLRSQQRKTFRRKLDNALPSLLNTLETFRARKEQEESDEGDLSEDIETGTTWSSSVVSVFILEQQTILFFVEKKYKTSRFRLYAAQKKQSCWSKREWNNQVINQPTIKRN